jgi:alpha-galactosidase
MRIIEKLTLLLVAVTLFPAIAAAQKWGGLAETPPTGWNSWNNFGCNVDEKLIRDTADALVASGMKDAGYEYVVIDDCWHGERDEQGFIRPNPEHFPSGMKALGDYIHSKGLKFGIYSDVGARTCAGRPGSRGHEYQDAMTYASWGVDYLKYDWCNSEGLNPVGAYTTMRDALRKTERPIVLSICEWGDNKPWEWAKDIGHLWRTTGDITACWDCVEDHGTWYSNGIMKILDMQKGLRIHAGPGHWNDPDMMEVGNGMSESEDRAHFSMWAMLAAPLIAGNDVRNMSAATREILTNKEAIAVNQDPLGIQGMPALTYGNGLEVWVKPLKDGGWAFCFLNRSDSEMKISFDWKEHFIKDDFSHYQFDAKRREYSVRDLWGKKDLGSTGNPLKAAVGSHDVFMVRLALQ